MDGFGGTGFNAVSSVKKKRRSTTSRRPRPDSQFVVEGRDASSLSSTPSSENGSKLSPDQNLGYDTSFRRKEFSLNSSTSRTASINKIEGFNTSKKTKKEDKKYGELSGFYGTGNMRGGQSVNSDLKRCSEGVLAPANWKSAGKGREGFEMQSRSSDSYAGHNSGHSVGGSNGSAENKLRKVKLKVGGVTRTIHAKSNSHNDNSCSSNAKASRPSDAPRHRQKLILEDSDDDCTPPEKEDDLQGVPWKDFSAGGFSHGATEDSCGKMAEESLTGKQILASEPIRKSKRVPKRRVLDGGAFDDGDEDAEIRYLEKLKTSRVGTEYNSEYEDDGEESVKKKKISTVSKSRRSGYDVDEDYGSSRLARESRNKLRTGREYDDTDYVEEEEPGSDDGVDAKRKKQKRESVDTLPVETRMEPLTTRQRALQSGKGALTGGNLIEFPNGLPPAPPRKQKEKLSEVEQQAKKAEAAQRRRMQVEKAARESEAEAIRKILGQDSSRKKKEDKIRKERDEMAQKRAAEALVLAPNTIRWVMGPTGTIVTFGEDIGLPTIFNPKTTSYPPPREKCAGPSCPNAYRYRDSKSNLPLCSLRCYKAVRQSAQPVSSC